MSFVKKLLRCYSGSSEVLPARRVINNTQEQDFIARRVLCEHKVKGRVINFYFLNIMRICQFLTDM